VSQILHTEKKGSSNNVHIIFIMIIFSLILLGGINYTVVNESFIFIGIYFVILI